MTAAPTVRPRRTPATAPVVASTRTRCGPPARALAGTDVAVVMTMGALHEGHAQLLREARRVAEHVILTIFLNPLQFGPKEDLSRYPRTFDDDMRIATAEGVDIVFAPTPDVVYPDGDPGVRVSAGPLGDVLEGKSRPGPLRRRRHRRGQAAPPHRRPPGLLRAEGRPAAAPHPPHGARPRLPRRRRLGADGARARRPRPEQPQHLPHRLRPRGRPLPEPRAHRGSRRRRHTGPRRSAVRPGTSSSRSRSPSSTTSCSCTRARCRTCPSGTAARRCSRSPPGSATTRLIDNTPILVGPGGGRLDVFSQPDSGSIPARPAAG